MHVESCWPLTFRMSSYMKSSEIHLKNSNGFLRSVFPWRDQAGSTSEWSFLLIYTTFPLKKNVHCLGWSRRMTHSSMWFGAQEWLDFLFPLAGMDWKVPSSPHPLPFAVKKPLKLKPYNLITAHWSFSISVCNLVANIFTVHSLVFQIPPDVRCFRYVFGVQSYLQKQLGAPAMHCWQVLRLSFRLWSNNSPRFGGLGLYRGLIIYITQLYKGFFK